MPPTDDDDDATVHAMPTDDGELQISGELDDDVMADWLDLMERRPENPIEE